MLYIAFISVFGSQNNFLYNRIGAVYEGEQPDSFTNP